MGLGTALLVLFVDSICMMALLARLRGHRIDLGPHQHVGQGRSAFWLVNVLDSRNYDSAGKRRLRWVSVTQGVWLLCTIAIILGLIFRS